MEADYSQGDPERGETGAQRLDRNWDELLQEMRVTQTGIQILFGFLLVLPFQQRFTLLDRFDLGLYLAVVALVTASTILNLTPVIAHRLLFRLRVKDLLVTWGARFMVASLMLLGLALVGGVTLIVDVAMDGHQGRIFGGVTLALIVLSWFGVPALMRRGKPADD